MLIRCVPLVALLLILTLTTAVAATAQTVAAPAQPPADAPAKPPAPPIPGMGGFVGPGQTFWLKTISLGGSFNSSPFKQVYVDARIPGIAGEQKAVQAALSIVRATNLRSIDVESAVTYATVDPIGKASDHRSFSVDFDFRQKDGQRYFFLTRYAWYTDLVRRVDYSHQAQFGVGALVVDQPKVKVGLVPVIAVLREHKGLADFDDRFLAGFGGIARMIISPNPHVQIEQRTSFQQAFNDSRFRVIQTMVTMRGQVAKPLSLQFSLTHNYDKVLGLASATLPGFGLVQLNKTSQVMMTGGIQIKF